MHEGAAHFSLRNKTGDWMSWERFAIILALPSNGDGPLGKLHSTEGPLENLIHFFSNLLSRYSSLEC